MMDYLKDILPELLRLSLWCLTVALYAVLGIINRKHIIRRWKQGTFLALVLLGTMLPSIVFSMAYLELSSIETGIHIWLIVGIFLGSAMAAHIGLNLGAMAAAFSFGT